MTSVLRCFPIMAVLALCCACGGNNGGGGAVIPPTLCMTLAPSAVTSMLRAAGAPVEPRELGWPPEFFAAALHHAREIRNRYTFLDLAVDADL